MSEGSIIENCHSYIENIETIPYAYHKTVSRNPV